MKVLVAGGAGYIGSHCVRELLRHGHEPVVVDSLVYGHRHAVPPEIPFYEQDLNAVSEIAAILQKHQVEAVLHFAAYAYVGESVSEPLKYYTNNVGATIALLQAMEAASVGKLVFSSTCATYGVPEQLPMTEATAQEPINPYGRGKLMVEWMLRDLARAGRISFCAFRYFNAAGASSDGAIGEDHTPETHLIPLAIAAATGRGPALKIFGTDYDTPDGTCLRDYVHVEDLASAHVGVLKHLDSPGRILQFNLGTGQPASVREVIAAVEKASGRPVPVEEAPRREGDPPSLYADNRLVVRELGWEPKYPDLDAIVESAWRWHRDHPQGYAAP